jgi:hypothetical protein
VKSLPKRKRRVRPAALMLSLAHTPFLIRAKEGKSRS